MTPEQLRAAIQAAIESHPHIRVSEARHAKWALRYVADNGKPIALEPRGVRTQTLWVRADSVDPANLGGIELVPKGPGSTAAGGKPNHDLYGEPGFKNTELFACKVTDLWQAVRVVAEVAGAGGRP